MLKQQLIILTPILVKSKDRRYSVDVLYFKTAEADGNGVHSTQKTATLGKYLISTVSNLWDIVLDNTSGAGPFLVAALKEGRNFIGIEKNEDVALFKKKRIDYIKVTKSRINQAVATTDPAILANLERINLASLKYRNE